MMSRFIQGFTNRARPLAGLALVMGLSACAFAPGGHIDYDTDTAPLDDAVEVQPITLGLVKAMDEKKASKADRSAAAELYTSLKDYRYRVGPGDVLNIIVYEHPELTIPAGPERSAAEAGNQVRSDGTIFYPYIGRINVEGLTLDAIREKLTRQLARYITDPQIDVGVADFRSKKVYVSGAVAQPGTLPITTVPLTITDAISQVGGAAPEADWHNIIITRDGKDIPVSLYALLRQGDQGENYLLRDGDIIYVPTAVNQGVAVLGQVLRPGNVPLSSERLSLTGAIARAGGVNETSAEPSGIFVIRGAPENSDKIATVYQLDISNAVAFNLGSRFPLQPRDIVYVTTAPVARWNRVISLLLPSVNLPGVVADTTNDVTGLRE
ncbi:MAG: polysaccharide export protein [Halomonas sp.]|nr:polysaccharide export protein [Halomonas sp.]